MKKFIIVFMFIFTLVTCQVNQCYADAGSITIAGGSIGVAGLGAAGLAGLTGPVVVAVFCAALAFGMDIELTEASEAAGMTKTEFIKNKIQDYCNEANITLGVFNKAILDGMNILQNGSITLSDQAAKQIKQFFNWLWNTEQVSTGDLGATVNIGDYTLPVNSTFQYTVLSGNRVYTCTSDKNFAMFFSTKVTGSQAYPVFISNQEITIHIQSNDNTYHGNVTLSRIRNNYYYNYNTSFGYDTVNNISAGSIPIIDETINNILDSGEGFDIQNDITSDSFTGTREDYNSRSGILDPTAGQTVVVNPGLNIPVPSDKDLTIDVNSYLEAIQKVLDKLNDITIPAVDDVDGIPTEIDIPDETVIDPTIEKEDDTDLPDPEDNTPVINEDDTPVGPAAVEPLKFNLRYIFPFCIPFDVKDMISMLSAEPEAPRYHVSWEIPWINENLEFTVDLSGFDSVAAICRKMELLLFVVGLAVVTRSMFIRS